MWKQTKNVLANKQRMMNQNEGFHLRFRMAIPNGACHLVVAHLRVDLLAQGDEDGAMVESRIVVNINPNVELL
jgi:hypothetical protein